MKLALLWLSITAATCAQAQAPSVRQETQGPCSVAVSGNNNQVFTCQGFDEKTATQILAIVNRIAAKQLDPVLVMEKLDEIQKSIGDIKLANSQRHLTPEQKQLMLPILKTEAPQELYFDCSPDPESQRYFAEISAFLAASGWKVMVHPYNWGTIQTYPPGLQVQVADMKNPPRGAAALQTAFRNAGVEAAGAVFFMLPPDKFALYVGSNPAATH